jgi:hypothetical protein
MKGVAVKKSIEQACKDVLETIRRELANAEGDERDVYRAFVDAIGSEVDGWKMRLDELDDED